MNIEQLKLGNIIESEITSTTNAMKGVEEIISKRKVDRRDNELDDGHFWLSLSEHKDGSGAKAILTRYYGNGELLEVIKSTLEKQLKELNDKFEAL